MALRKCPDGNGDTMSLFEWDGRLVVSNNSMKHWHQVSAMASRDDDVLLCGYPKSGLHWLWEIVTMLKTGSPHLSSRRMENTGFLMISSCAQLDSLPCPRVLTTHHRFHDLPLDFILRRRKMVCILRDPKDVCVSSYHMNSSLKHTEYDGTFQGFIPLFLAGHVPLGSWFGWILSFERGLKEHPELSVHVIHYEHLKADPAGEIKRLAKYLDAPESLAEEVARQTEFSAMKTFKNSLDNSFAVYYKSNTDSIFRKGEAHQWKQYFTPEQAEQFDAQLAKHLGRSSVVAKL